MQTAARIIAIKKKKKTFPSGDKCPRSKYSSATINKIKPESKRRERERKREKEDTNTRIRTFDTRNAWRFVEFSAAIELERGTSAHSISSRSARAFKEIESKKIIFFSSLSLFLFLLRRTKRGERNLWTVEFAVNEARRR